jgi:cell division protein FtsB
MASQMGMDPQTSAKERTDRAKKRIELAIAIVGLLTAIVTAVVSIRKVGTANEQVDTANRKADTSQQQIQALADENEALRRQNADLKSRLKGSEPEPSPSDSGLADAAAIYHQGPLVLKQGTQANMDAPPEDPQWGLNNDPTNFSMYYNGGGGDLSFQYGVKHVLTEDRPSFDTCRNATGYSEDDAVKVTAMKRATTLCIITADGRYSALHIKSADSSQLSFDVTTYAKEGD